jgi:phosphotransferase system  glucose/maltose/N-acetylglucosamine-specific IIC component
MPTLLTPEQLQARNRRSLWIALGLVGFIVLIFLTTFLRMQSNLAERKALNAAATAEAAR